MSKTYIMTLRLPEEVGRSVARLAARQGHKPAQLGAWAVEEFVRRRKFPQIDLRDTAAGRVAYVGGTRFAVYWVVEQIRGGMPAEEFTKDYGVPIEKISEALAYTAAYPLEIEADLEHAADNERWLKQLEDAWQTGRRPTANTLSNTKRKRTR